MLFATKVKKVYPYLHAFLIAAGFLWCYSAGLTPGLRDIILFALLSYGILIHKYEEVNGYEYDRITPEFKSGDLSFNIASGSNFKAS